MKIILAFLFLLTIKLSFASGFASLVLSDTSVKKDYKLDKEQFLERHGCDDSSRALISFYFKKRTINKRNFYAGAFFSFVGGLAILPVKNLPDMGDYGSPGYTPGDKLPFTIGIICFLVAGLPLLIVGGSLLLRYKRKRLGKILNDYFEGRPIPKGIVKNRYFNLYLKLDKSSR